MKKTLHAALAATLVLTGSAMADLTKNGEVGLPLNPTAQIPEAGGVRVQANYYDMGDPAFAGVNLGSVKYYGIVAAGRIGENIELNGGINKLNAKDSAAVPPGTLSFADKSGISLGAKYLFTRESDPAGVRLAAGLSYNSAMLKNTAAYVVGTKYFGEVTGERIPMTGHLGLRYDRFKTSVPVTFAPGVAATTKSSKVSLFAGLEVPVTATGDWTLVGELQSKNNQFGGAKMPYSASVRYRPQGQGFSVSAGLARTGLVNDNGLFVQLGYTFDTGVAK